LYSAHSRENPKSEYRNPKKYEKHEIRKTDSERFSCFDFRASCLIYMVVQKAINNLKQGPKDDKVAVASGIAISVVVVLLAAWAIFFFRGVQKNANQLNLGGGAQDEFNFSSVKEAQEKLKQEYSNTADEFLQLRNEAASQEMQFQQQTGVQGQQGSGADQFGTQNTTY